ncbi:DUF1800 family protein [Glaciecola siphonariae]|uniref:DUF1800 family protein n=1 Tax=Glaciecola siphonariae TaxID=521012 RepID=A0ABV9LQ10_9ALTE
MMDIRLADPNYRGLFNKRVHVWRVVFCASLLFVLTACGGGGSSEPEPPSAQPAPTPTTPAPPSTPAPSPVVEPNNKFATPQQTSRFLTMATFGPRLQDIEDLTGTSASAWMVDQFNAPTSEFLSEVQRYFEMGEPAQRSMLADAFDQGATTYTFWKNAVHGEDQLRQRMAFALSQILVVSNGSGGLNGIFPQTVGYYQQVLADNALGNYRDLLEAVTYTPAMAEYLTYLGNEKGDESTGRVPDENYSREILQLFTIGLVELNQDGTVVTDVEGNPVEVYDNNDITGLAKVFTGLNNPELDIQSSLVGRITRIRAAVLEPLLIDESKHEPGEKSFLDFTIPAGTQGEASIDMALDHIMAHPNVGPFVGRQLIQRFVTSNPSPAYVERVANAFDAGSYTLPNGEEVGDGRKGDLKATIAAILFDESIYIANALADDTFGKVREPVLRLSHFMRAFETDMTTPEYVFQFYDTSSLSVLGQHPYRSPSVFNFYRPGYKAPGTLSAEQGLVAPELQIVNASSIPGYINLLSYGALQSQRENFDNMRPVFIRFGANFDASRAQQTFIPNYADLLPLADDAEALVEYLDGLLLYNTLSESSKTALIDTLNAFAPSALTEAAGREALIGYAVLMLMSSPDYLVQR